MPDTQMIPHGTGSANTLTAATVESVVLDGDLSKLSAPQRVSFYRAKCDSLGLNWLTQPFAYITLNGKLTLYARKDAADQLRKKHGISIEKPDITFTDEWIIVNVLARTPEGRTDADTGVVNKKDMRGDFGNALMKAVTKAKRRLTLSICGLGMLDETEIETIPNAHPVMLDDMVEEVVPQVVSPTNGDMTLEEAVNYTDSKGHLYSKVSSAGLLNIRKNITLKLKEPMTQMEQDSYMHKVDAIKIILDARADGRLEEPVAV